MEDSTISGESPVGKRLGKIPKATIRCLVHDGRKIALSDEMSLGRDRENDIVIDDPLVSRFHAVVRRIRDAYWVEDLESTNGTWVNGKRVEPGRSVRLSAGDVVKVGNRIPITFS